MTTQSTQSHNDYPVADYSVYSVDDYSVYSFTQRLLSQLSHTTTTHSEVLRALQQVFLKDLSALGRVLVVPNFFHFRMMEATVFLGTFNAA